MAAAKRPLIYIGGGVISAGASDVLRRLNESLDMPVVSTLMGLGAYDAQHPRFLGMVGMHGTYEANMAMLASYVPCMPTMPRKRGCCAS